MPDLYTLDKANDAAHQIVQAIEQHYEAATKISEAKAILLDCLPGLYPEPVATIAKRLLVSTELDEETVNDALYLYDKTDEVIEAIKDMKEAS